MINDCEIVTGVMCILAMTVYYSMTVLVPAIATRAVERGGHALGV